MALLVSYLKITLSLLFKDRLYSFINIFGLAVGLGACILIGLFVRHEFSFDSYHPEADRIYRVTRDYYARNGTPEMRLATNAPPVAPQLVEDFAEVEAATRISNGFNLLVRHGETARYEDRIHFADANVFEFFSFNWLQGVPGTALAAPGSVVLTESMATRYFGDSNPVGEVLEAQYGISLKVTGVIADLPGNTHLRFDALASLTTLSSRPGADFSANWGDNNFHTYVKLREGASAESLAAAFPDFLNRHHQADASTYTGMSIQRLTGIRLRSADLQLPMKPPGNLNTVLAFIAVAFCILLIACVNFTNLSVARSIKRGKEVGMRKVVGAGRLQIAAQFLGESVLSALIALLLGIVLVELALPVFNVLLDARLSFDLAADPWLGLILPGATVAVGLLAGAYPAFYLSAFRSARVLRGDMEPGVGGRWFRNGLVVLQFSAAIILVVATSVVYRQLDFARSVEPGFDQDGVVVLDNLDSRWEALKSELLKYPGILAATASNMAPGENNANALMVRYEGGADVGFGMQFLMVDYGFFSTYGIELLAGREFSPEFGADRVADPDVENPHVSGGVVLSVAAVRRLGWTPESALGKWFELGLENDFSQSVRGIVVGVSADIHFESVATLIEPVAYLLPPLDAVGMPGLSTASIRMSDSNREATLDFINSLWSEVYSDRPIAHSFLDETFAALYRREEKLGALCAWFASLAILIACLGLFGLASFNAQRRIKEIGVRKVMGGSVWSIVWLLTNDFSKLVLISNVVAWPLAYVAMERWLQNFAYRIDLTPLVFIGSGLIALCIAWVTVGGTAAKAASAKPVLALRYE